LLTCPHSETGRGPWYLWQGGFVLSTKVLDRFSLTPKRSEEGEQKVVSYYH
jgi:hypothetical protein